VYPWAKYLQQISAEPSHLIITANNRIAEFLIKDWCQYQTCTASVVPVIMPWQAWVKNLHQELLFLGRTEIQLISTVQQHRLWQQSLSSSNHITNVQNLTHDMSTAWQYLQHWQISLEQVELYTNPDQLYFLRSVRHYLSLCSDYGLTDEPSAILDLIRNIEYLNLPKHIVMIGFSEQTPLQQLFFKCLVNKKIQVKPLLLELPHESEKYRSFVEFDQEIAAMAEWAFTTDLNTRLPLICIVPDIHKQYSQIAYHFRKTQSYHHSSRKFDIGGGEVLFHLPLIRALYISFKIYFSKITTDEAAEWLQSLYLVGAHEEQVPRLLLLEQLSKQYDDEIDLQQLMIRSQQFNSPILHASMNSIHLNNEPQSMSFWLDTIDSITEKFFQLSSRSLSSFEYQLLKKWQQVLLDLESFSQLKSKFTSIDIINDLTHLLKTTLFDIENKHPDIQILGLLEATGLVSQATWVSQFCAESWPMPVKLNPFIPFNLQHQYQLPHSSARRQLSYAKSTQKIWHRTWQNIFYSFTSNEDSPATPTPLLAHLQVETSKIDYHSKYRQNCEPKLEQIDDSYGSSYTLKKVSGGSSVIKNQAQCPFKAYMYHRLELKPQPLEQLGVNALDRGIILHTVLEKFWLKYQTSIRLNQLTSSSIENSLTDIYNEWIIKKHVYPEVIHQLELNRTIKIIKKWLSEEQKRPPFIVESLETTCNFTVNNLQFNLRVDRIDKLANGNYLIIDYKTSKKPLSVNQWQTPRVNEPQLPIYALANTQKSHAIAFVTINANIQKIHGLSQYDTEISGIKAIQWQTQLADWENDIVNLVAQFQAGYAAVNPKTSGTCQFCELASICRVQEHE